MVDESRRTCGAGTSTAGSTCSWARELARWAGPVGDMADAAGVQPASPGRSPTPTATPSCRRTWPRRARYLALAYLDNPFGESEIKVGEIADRYTPALVGQVSRGAGPSSTGTAMWVSHDRHRARPRDLEVPAKGQPDRLGDERPRSPASPFRGARCNRKRPPRSRRTPTSLKPNSCGSPTDGAMLSGSTDPPATDARAVRGVTYRGVGQPEALVRPPRQPASLHRPAEGVHRMTKIVGLSCARCRTAAVGGDPGRRRSGRRRPPSTGGPSPRSIGCPSPPGGGPRVGRCRRRYAASIETGPGRTAAAWVGTTHALALPLEYGNKITERRPGEQVRQWLRAQGLRTS